MDVERVIQRLRTAKRITILTGAGVSAASGVPTFRGADGLWRNFRPEELATRSAFARNPELVWEWYAWRREIVAQCAPNSAHAAIAALETFVPHFLLVTQNVDGLHRHALAQGLRPDAAPADATWGERYFHISDPDGHELSFATPLA